MTKPKSVRALKQKPLPKPSEPARFEVADASALQALYDGKATAEQQKRALTWIITQASGEAFFQPGGLEGQRETEFGMGRAFVRQQILGLLKINLSAILQEERPTQTQ